MASKGRVIYGKAVHQKHITPAGGVDMVTFIPWALIKRGVKREIITPLSSPQSFGEEASVAVQQKPAKADSALVRALGLAYHWQRTLDMGKVLSVAELAASEGISKQRVSFILRLTQLAPAIVDGVLHGVAPKWVTLDYFKKNSVPLCWSVQQTTLTHNT
jgi:hypothetical protein